MWILVLMALLLVVTPSFAEQTFSEQYKRDYNIFNPSSQSAPDNPLNPAQAFAPDNPFNPANRFDPGNPVNPANRYAPDNPFNPANRYNPDNPLNPANRYNPTPPLRSAPPLAVTAGLSKGKTGHSHFLTVPVCVASIFSRGSGLMIMRFGLCRGELGRFLQRRLEYSHTFPSSRRTKPADSCLVMPNCDCPSPRL
jgi:hypothetical protein